MTPECKHSSTRNLTLRRRGGAFHSVRSGGTWGGIVAVATLGIVAVFSGLLLPSTATAALVQQRAERPPLDPWLTGPTRSEQKALEGFEKARLDLDIVAQPLGAFDPCTHPGGSNLVNFVRRGASPGDPTYMFGIDLCTRRPFTYSEPTRAGAIIGFDANPPDVHWADDPGDDRNLRGDRFGAEILVGVEMLFGTSTLDFGETASGTVDFAAAPAVGFRVGKFHTTFARAAAPVERTWLLKVSVSPFRADVPKRFPTVVEPVRAPGETAVTWFEPVPRPCNADGVGIRGFDEFRVGPRRGDRQYPVSMRMVSYCGDAEESEGHEASSDDSTSYEAYSVETLTDRTWFSQFNSSFPKFATWSHVPRGGLLESLSLSLGVGEVLNDVFNVDFPTNVFYVGIGITFNDSRWRIEAGRMFTNETLDVISADVPVTVTAEGWTVQVQRALHLEFLGL